MPEVCLKSNLLTPSIPFGEKLPIECLRRFLHGQDSKTADFISSR